MSYTADEVWEYIPGCEGSVHEQRFPERVDLLTESERNDWDTFFDVREFLHLSIEPLRSGRSLKTSLSACITGHLACRDRAAYDALLRIAGLGEDIRDLLVVSNSVLLDQARIEEEMRKGYAVLSQSLVIQHAPELKAAEFFWIGDDPITKDPGTECPRCWSHRGGHGTGEDAALCVRCAAVVA
ncbi:MAG TPA: hypothetical protein DHV93_00085, partial [Holophagaceae bacterium]|nr:hypothetical protein [Holophagaceae bacterium]